MESKEELKIEKFKQMLKNAQKRNELIIIELLQEISSSLEENISNEKFDQIIFNKIQELSIKASTNFKKKEQKLGEQNIYCLSLLSHCFFNKLIETTIVKNKVKLIDKRI